MDVTRKDGKFSNFFYVNICTVLIHHFYGRGKGACRGGRGELENREIFQSGHFEKMVGCIIEIDVSVEAKSERFVAAKTVPRLEPEAAFHMPMNGNHTTTILC